MTDFPKGISQWYAQARRAQREHERQRALRDAEEDSDSSDDGEQQTDDQE